MGNLVSHLILIRMRKFTEDPKSGFLSRFLSQFLTLELLIKKMRVCKKLKKVDSRYWQRLDESGVKIPLGFIENQ